MKNRVALSIWTFAFTLAIFVGRLIQYEGISRGPKDNFIRSVNSLDVAMSLAAFVLIWTALLAVNWQEEKLGMLRKLTVSQGVIDKSRAVFFSSFGLMLIAWLPYILTLAPGVVNTDTNSSISQIIWYGHPNNSHFPVFFTLYLGLFCKLGLAVSNINAGLMAYSIVQTLIMAGTLAYTLVFLYRRKLRMWLLIIFALFYALVPLFPIYAMNVHKDVIFSCALIWTSILLVERDKKYGAIALSASCLVAMLFRSNGLYVVLGLAVIGTAISRDVKRLLLPLISSICVYALLIAGVTHIWDIRRDYKENMGIPLQQLAAVISDGNELPEADEQLLYRILPKETWESEYAPCLADNIKWADGFDSDFFDANKKEFLAAWLHGLVRYPGKYVEAYAMETFGYWVPFTQDGYGYADTVIFDGGFGIQNTDLF